MEKFDNFIGGRWHKSSSYVRNINPAKFDHCLGEYASGDANDVDLAVVAAQNAQPGWFGGGPQLRHDVLLKASQIILDRKAEIGRMLAEEEGKTLPESIGETVRAAQIFDFFAGEALRQSGDALPSVRPNVDVIIEREPLGIVGLITPWNFPIAIPAWKAAPALAFGNAVVLKPAELTPGCAHLLAQVLQEAGCPDGVFNLVMGAGSKVGARIVEHPNIDGISFTGSVPTGRKIGAACLENGKQVQLEMGGKNPMIIADDADLDVAISASINGAYFSTGQRCTASSRLIVTEKVHDQFVERLIKETQALIVGDPLDERTQIGPVVDKGQLDQNLKYVELAKSEGCEVFGGERMSETGYYQRPAIFVGASNQMRVSQEEIFGPCASVIKADDYDAALTLANDTQFGLSAGICTQSLKTATHFRKNAKAGMVMVNLPTAGVDYHVPFGGAKASSFGPREQGSAAKEFYTKSKTSYLFA